jgi:hypothetical protein
MDIEVITFNSNKAITSVHNEYLSKNRLNLQPPYQRHLVWTKQQKTNLIDTIMKGYPIPLFLIYNNGTLECVDGQNRFHTIKEYIEQDTDPWAWVIEKDEHTEYVYYSNETTATAMNAFCLKMTKANQKKGKLYKI